MTESTVVFLPSSEGVEDRVYDIFVELWSKVGDDMIRRRRGFRFRRPECRR